MNQVHIDGKSYRSEDLGELQLFVERKRDVEFITEDDMKREAEIIARWIADFKSRPAVSRVTKFISEQSDATG